MYMFFGRIGLFAVHRKKQNNFIDIDAYDKYNLR